MKLGAQFFRFCLVGCAGLLVDMAALYAASHLLDWYSARALSFVAAATATWLLNRSFTFAPTSHHGQTPSRSVWSEYLQYMTSMLGGALLNYSVYAAFVTWVQHPWSPYMGVAAGSIAGLSVNFFLARQVVFKARKTS
jgi:putative flippase GtrA